MLSKKNRIQSRQLIATLLKEGALFKNTFFTVRYLAEGPVPCFAILVSKKTAKDAAPRNLIKRRISESLRLNLKAFKKSISALIIAKVPAVKAGFEKLDAGILEFIRYFNKA